MKPNVGISSVLMTQDGYVLLGERLQGRGKGLLASPGGHLEFGESIFTCALRELEEETGLSLRLHFHRRYHDDGTIDCIRSHPDHLNCSVKFLTFSEEITWAEPKYHKTLVANHYVTMYVRVLIEKRVEVFNLEPHKHGDWKWYAVDELPDNIWKPLDRVIHDDYHSLEPIHLW